MNPHKNVHSGAHTKAKIHFTIKHHRTLPKSQHVYETDRLRNLEVFYTREVQGVQMWLTTIPSTYFMSLYLVQVDMNCELRTFIAIDMTVALQWETKFTAIDRVLSRISGLLQMMHKWHMCVHIV